MKNIVKIVLLSGAAVSLAACACPKKSDYTAVPYADERTAGNGTVVYEGKCHTGGDKASYAFEDERTKGDTMFESKMRK